MENIIKINKLGYNYGEGWILHDLSVEISQGDFVAVIGLTGQGKYAAASFSRHSAADFRRDRAVRNAAAAIQGLGKNRLCTAESC